MTSPTVRIPDCFRQASSSVVVMMLVPLDLLLMTRGVVMLLYPMRVACIAFPRPVVRLIGLNLQLGISQIAHRLAREKSRGGDVSRHIQYGLKGIRD